MLKEDMQIGGVKAQRQMTDQEKGKDQRRRVLQRFEDETLGFQLKNAFFTNGTTKANAFPFKFAFHYVHTMATSPRILQVGTKMPI